MSKKKPLTEEVAEVILDVVRECGPKYWTLGETQTDRGYRVRATWDEGGQLYLENQETGHTAEFQVAVTATQLPEVPYCGQCDTARHVCPGCGTDVPHGTVACGPCATVPPVTLAEGEHPGPALVVGVVEAVRAYLKTQGVAVVFPSPTEAALLRAVEALETALEAEAEELGQPAAGHWEPSAWMAVKDGDRVRLNGVEATVTTAVRGQWLGSGARQVNVVLEGWNDGKPYTMKPSGAVDIWRPALPDWAAQAFATLAAAGLKPERTEP